MVYGVIYLDERRRIKFYREGGYHCEVLLEFGPNPESPARVNYRWVILGDDDTPWQDEREALVTAHSVLRNLLDPGGG